MLKTSGRTWWMAALAAMLLVIGALAVSQRAAAASPMPLRAATAQDTLTQALVDALLSKDYPALAATAAPDISVVTWLGERRMFAADDALAMLQAAYLDPAADPYIDGTTNLGEWFGTPPTQLWRNAAIVESVLYVRGLGVDGTGEALVGIGDNTLDAAQWTALLFAESGFGTPDARAANATSAAGDVSATAADAAPTAVALETSPEELAAVQFAADPAPGEPGELNILRTVNVYPTPDPDAAPVGLLRRNQTIAILGRSDDGEYFEVLCPLAIADRCWVVNDPGSVEPVVSAAAMARTDAPAVSAADAATADTAATDAPERVSFLTGEVAASRLGVVAPATPVNYVLRVLAGQMLTVDLISGGDVANFSVTGAANGQPYKRMENESRNWTFVVPVTQDYLIRIVAPVPTQYSLTVVVPPLGMQPSPTPLPVPSATPTTAAAERISFAKGATSASRGGKLDAEQSMAYDIRVLRGQEMTTALYSTGSLSYSIVGADGTPIKRREVGGSPFVFTVPTTQDYRITIFADAALEYALNVTVPPLLPAATTTPAAPVRLSVPAGGTSVSATYIVDAYGRDGYLVRALAGQTMYVSIDSPDNIANFSLVGVRDGQPLKRLENEDRAWQGMLPATQDYLITVANPLGVRVQYTLYVSFSPLQGNAPTVTPQPSGPPQRIVFPAGGTTATVSGTAPQSYVLRALAGQVMSIQLYADGIAAFSVSGADGTVLKSSGIGAGSWSGDLPSNQDYTITVIPVSGSTGFTLVVTVVF